MTQNALCEDSPVSARSQGGQQMTFKIHQNVLLIQAIVEKLLYI